MAVVNEATGKNACPTLKIEGSLEGLALPESNIEPNEGAAPGHPRSFAPPTPPINLHEYQNKGFTKFAIRKWLIPKDAILVVGDWLTEKRKAGARSRRPNVVLNRVKYTQN